MDKPDFPIRLAIVQCDNRAVARAALCQLLSQQANLVIAAEAGHYQDALEVVGRTAPDIIVLDSGNHTEKEIELVRGLAALFTTQTKAPRILILTSAQDEMVQSRFVSAGALGLVQQEQSPEVLVRAIHCLQAGEIWLERALAARVMRENLHPRPVDPHDPHKRIALLTERETEVITFICEGLKNQAIAQRLFISEATVRHRLTSIFEKLQLSDRLELVIFAYRHGLADIPR